MPARRSITPSTPTHLDKVAVGGALTLPTSGQVTIDVNDLGGLQNGTPLFTFGSLTNPFSSVFVCDCRRSPPPRPTGFAYGFARNGNEIDLLAPWKASYKKWAGAGSGGAWDVGVTANFSLRRLATTFANDDVVVFDDTASNINVTIAAGGVQSRQPADLRQQCQRLYHRRRPDQQSAARPTTLIVSGGGQVTLEQQQHLHRRHADLEPQHADARHGNGPQSELHGPVVRTTARSSSPPR